MSYADCTPGGEPRSVAASQVVHFPVSLFSVLHFSVLYFSPAFSSTVIWSFIFRYRWSLTSSPYLPYLPNGCYKLSVNYYTANFLHLYLPVPEASHSIQPNVNVSWLLWPPYVIGQAIIFLPCGFFFYLLFSSPNLSRRRLNVYHTSTHGVALVWI